MKKGFTMIELLAVFTLMGIILIFTIPQITSIIKKNSGESYENYTKTICQATEAYVVNTNKKVTTTVSTFTASEVISAGYLKSSLKNPNNNKKLSDYNLNNIKIRMVKDSNNVLKCDIDGL